MDAQSGRSAHHWRNQLRPALAHKNCSPRHGTRLFMSWGPIFPLSLGFSFNGMADFAMTVRSFMREILGFSVYDPVAYNQKHNEANGHENQEGVDNNRSWNCGSEEDMECRYSWPETSFSIRRNGIIVHSIKRQRNDWLD